MEKLGEKKLGGMFLSVEESLHITWQFGASLITFDLKKQ
jgi:hypothetical protein